MRTLHRLSLVVVLSLVATFSLAGAALAQYAPGGGITCDSSTVLAGEAFECSASGFLANTDVSVTASGSTTDGTPWTYETTVEADASGVATATIQTPDDATGSTTVTFAGLDEQGDARVLSNATAVTVAQPAADGGTVDGAPDDDLPATGSDTTGGVVAMAALITVGAALLLVTRRRTRDRIEA